MKIIDGTNIVMGRLASYVAKELLRGEKIDIINCDKVIDTGNNEMVKEEFLKKRGKTGRMQRGPTYIRSDERIVKRTIRGMLPNYRRGRGRIAWKNIKCHIGIPKEFENKETIKLPEVKKKKFVIMGEFK